MDIRSKGRPTVGTDKMKIFDIHCPESLMDAVIEKANYRGQSRAEFIRRALAKAVGKKINE